jgi:hypothetical protein
VVLSVVPHVQTDGITSRLLSPSEVQQMGGADAVRDGEDEWAKFKATYS